MDHEISTRVEKDFTGKARGAFRNVATRADGNKGWQKQAPSEKPRLADFLTSKARASLRKLIESQSIDLYHWHTDEAAGQTKSAQEFFEELS
jgi:hypothetical protein